MEQSDSDNLQPPSLDGVFARKRREKEERGATPQWVEPYVAPTPVPAEPVVVEPVTVEAVPEVEYETETEAGQLSSETAVLPRVADDPVATARPKKAAKERAPKVPREPKSTKVKAPKVPKQPRAEKVRRRRRIPAVIPTFIAGGCSGGVLVGLVASFNRWGGQTDSINALELLGAFVAAIIAGFVLLAISRIGHRAAISFLGVGGVAVVLMFFPSGRWQTVSGSIIVVAATAVAYLAAHLIAREATDDN